MLGNNNHGAALTLTCVQGVKRKRTPRVTTGQLEALVAYLEERPFLHTRKFSGLQGRENFESGWKEVANQLNSIPNGSTKTPEQWITVWRDYKSRICAKASKISREKGRTGNRDPITAPLTNIEKRAIALIGHNYVFGTNCPDSMEINDMEVVAGADGGESRCNLQESQMYEYQVIVTENKVEEDLQEEDLFISDTSGTQVVLMPQASTSNTIIEYASKAPPTEDRISTIASPLEHIHEHNIPRTTPTSEIVNESRGINTASTPRRREERSRRNRNLNPRRCIAEQHASTRQEFLSIANSNAESMRMLASSSEMHAEAAKVQAEASLLLAQAISKIGDALISILNKNN